MSMRSIKESLLFFQSILGIIFGPISNVKKFIFPPNDCRKFTWMVSKTHKYKHATFSCFPYMKLYGLNKYNIENTYRYCHFLKFCLPKNKIHQFPNFSEKDAFSPIQSKQAPFQKLWKKHTVNTNKCLCNI